MNKIFVYIGLMVIIPLAVLNVNFSGKGGFLNSLSLENNVALADNKNSGFYDNDHENTYTIVVSSINQQTVKGLGGGMPWPSGNGFSITNFPVGQQKILDLGVSIVRIFWHNQGNMFDEFGVPTLKGLNIIDNFIDEIRWLSENYIPYNLSPGFNTLNSVECYFQKNVSFDGRPDGGLKQDYEGGLVDALIYVLRRIKEANLPMPIMVTPFNEPNCPINQGNAPVTGKMPVDQVVRIFKQMKQVMINEGFGDIELGYCDAGEVIYACEYLGNSHIVNGLHSLGDERWPFVNPASKQYDAALDEAIDCFVYHGYYAESSRLPPFVNGFDECNEGRDLWQTEYCYWHEDRGTGEAGIKRDYDTGMMSRFISDMAYLKANFWEMWIMWRTGNPPASDAMCTTNFNPPAYYAFQKIFKNITPGTTKVRRVSTDVPNMQDQNQQYMNTVAFVSEEKTIVVIVNGSDGTIETSVKGLYGEKAEVWQIKTGQETGAGKDYENNPRYNKPMVLINTARIANGMVKSVKLADHTITIIVTNGGEAIRTNNVRFMNSGKVYAAKSAENGRPLGRRKMPATPEKTGFTFLGWFTKENGKGAEFTSKTSVTKNITLYAYFKNGK